MGLAIVIANDILGIESLELCMHVNGELRQRAKIRDINSDIPALIASISCGITFMPGDVIATGIPAGVGIGFNPPKFLQPGDNVAIQIDEIGELKIKVM